MKRVYFDAEFTGLHQNTKLISIGLKTEDNHAFYAEFTDYEDGFVTESDRQFFEEHLKPKLIFARQVDFCTTAAGSLWHVEGCGDTPSVTKQLEDWFGKVLDNQQAQMWSDCLAYDWMLFCQLWGHARSLPPYINYIPMDLSTLLYVKGIDPDISRELFAAKEDDLHYPQKHNAAWDADLIKRCVEKAEAILLGF